MRPDQIRLVEMCALLKYLAEECPPDFRLEPGDGPTVKFMLRNIHDHIRNAVQRRLLADAGQEILEILK